MFCHEIAPFPDDILKLGHYVGPIPTMTTKILMKNGHLLQKSTYRLLAPYDVSDEDGIDAQKQVMAGVHLKLVSCVLPRNFEDIKARIAPQHDPYENEIQMNSSFCNKRKNLSPHQKWQTNTYEQIHCYLE